MIIDRKVLDKFPDVMSTQEVAKAIGVHPATVTLIARDPNSGLQCFRPTASKKAPFKFFKASVVEYIKSRQFVPETL